MKKHYVIYVPGILDDKYRLQSLVVKCWRLYGVHGHCHEIPWTAKEWQPKLQELLDKIDKYKSQGHTVSLIGASAGASGVLNAYIERKDSVSSLAYICGKINRPETVSRELNAANPAFKTSLEILQTNLKKLTIADKDKIRSLYSSGDSYVPPKDTVIPGVQEVELPALRHALAIAYSLTFGARQLLAQLKSAK